MAFVKQLSIYLFVLLFCTNVIDILCYCEKEDETYIIQSNGRNHLVMDGSDPSDMKIQYYDGSPQQLWKFQRASSAGLFYIVNAYTGTPLDIHRCDSVGCRLRLNGSGDPSQQEWYINYDNLIVHAARREFLNIYYSDFRPGAVIGIYRYNHTEPERNGNIHYTLVPEDGSEDRSTIKSGLAIQKFESVQGSVKNRK